MISSFQNTMETTRALCMFLLLNQMLLAPTDADQALSTIQTYSSVTEDQDGSRASTVKPSYTTSNHQNSTDGTIIPRGDCLIDTEMGLIAVGSAGGVIICLLVTIIVLAYQIFLLQRRVYAPRSSRSNLDLVSGAGYWDTDQAETGGLVGPCDTSVILEEVRADGKMEEERSAEIQEARAEAGAGHEDGTKEMTFVPEEKTHQMQSSTFRDSCLEVPRDIEDMPLVV